jgi:hypothetical protein
MIPSGMRFSSPSSAFQKLPTGDNDYQVHAFMRLKAGDGPEFDVSGDGPLPSPQAKNQAPVPVLPSSTTPEPNRGLPASSLRSEAKPEQTQPLWPWQAVTGGLTLACIFLVVLLLLRARNQPRGLWREKSAGLGDPAKPSILILENLKEKLFQLEADRARGAISAEEYSATRLALEETVERMVLGSRSGV